MFYLKTASLSEAPKLTAVPRNAANPRRSSRRQARRRQLLVHVIRRGDAGQHKRRAAPRHPASADVGMHVIADDPDIGGRQPEPLDGVSHDDRRRLADHHRLHAGGGGDRAAREPAPGISPHPTAACGRDWLRHRSRHASDGGPLQSASRRRSCGQCLGRRSPASSLTQCEAGRLQGDP